MTDDVISATGTWTTNGMPHGSTSLTPHLSVTPADAALDFYEAVFGAEVLDVTRFGDVVAHAELDFGAGHLTLGEPMESFGLVAPDPARGADFSLAVYVPDVDAVTERAVAAGATVREPATTFVSGDRYASILDPYGVRWTVMTRVKDLSPEESRRRVAEWSAAQTG